MELIVAMTKQYGIGLEGKLAWKCQEELNLFREKTLNNIVVMGRKTVEKLPILKDREVWCLTRDKKVSETTARVFNSFEDVIEEAKSQTKTVFIAGGATVFSWARNYKCVQKMHVSVMKSDYYCDIFWRPDFSIPGNRDWIITSKEEYQDFIHYTYERIHTDEFQYLDVLRYVFENGT